MFLRSPVFRSVGRDMNTQHSLSISATSAARSKTNLTSTRANHFAAILAWNLSVMLMVDKTLYSDNNWVIKVWTPRVVLSQNRPLLVITITSSASPPAELVSFCFLSSSRYCEEKHAENVFFYLPLIKADFSLPFLCHTLQNYKCEVEILHISSKSRGICTFWVKYTSIDNKLT